MVDLRRVQNVLYYEYSAATMDYDLHLDAFTVARADIHSPAHPHRVALFVIVTERELSEQRLLVPDAIRRARDVLERLVAENRAMVERLTVDVSWVFNLAGQRIR